MRETENERVKGEVTKKKRRRETVFDREIQNKSQERMKGKLMPIKCGY